MISEVVKPDFQHKGKAVIIWYRSIALDARKGASIDREDINFFASWSSTVDRTVRWTPKGKKKGYSKRLDKYTFCQLEVKGKVVWDSREHFPIDMKEWQERFDRERAKALAGD